MTSVLITGCSSGIERRRRPDSPPTDTGLRHRPPTRNAACTRRSGLSNPCPRRHRRGFDGGGGRRGGKAEGSIGVLVNNAGYSQSGAVESIPSGHSATVRTNVFGLIRMSQLVLPGMRRAGQGRIVNIGRWAATHVPRRGIYHATKYAVEAISDAMRFEGAKDSASRSSLVEPDRSPPNSPTRRSVPPMDWKEGPYGDFNTSRRCGHRGIYESRLAGLVAVARCGRRGDPSPRSRASARRRGYTVTRRRPWGFCSARSLLTGCGPDDAQPVPGPEELTALHAPDLRDPVIRQRFRSSSIAGPGPRRNRGGSREGADGNTAGDKSGWRPDLSTPCRRVIPPPVRRPGPARTARSA